MAAVGAKRGVEGESEAANQVLNDSQTAVRSEARDGSEWSIYQKEAWESTTKVSSDDDETTLQASLNDAMSDWSETGRGSHVDFDPGEVVPLKEGRSKTIPELLKVC